MKRPASSNIGSPETAAQRLPPLGVGPPVLQIAERQVRVERLTVLAPAFFVNVEVRHFPAPLAEFGTRQRAVGDPLREILPDKAMLSVGLPVDIKEGVPLRRAKAFLALAECPLGTFALGQIEHESDAFVPAFFEARNTDQHGHPAAVLPKNSFS